MKQQKITTITLALVSLGITACGEESIATASAKPLPANACLLTVEEMNALTGLTLEIDDNKPRSDTCQYKLADYSTFGGIQLSLIDTSELTAFGKKRAYNYGLDDAIENNLLQTRYPNYLHNPAGSMAYVPELVVKLDGREAVFKVSPFMGDENNKQSEINRLKKVAEAALKKLDS